MNLTKLSDNTYIDLSKIIYVEARFWTSESEIKTGLDVYFEGGKAVVLIGEEKENLMEILEKNTIK